MKAEDIFQESDFKRCVEFHGHTCPGMSIGYRAAKAALEWLQETRSADEELVAIVETDACGADAIQVLTGCTFGKGNFLFRDWGKHAFTLGDRKTGNGVRVALRNGVMRPNARQLELREKMGRGEATEGERKEFEALHDQRTCEILEKPLTDLFTISPTSLPLPPKAKVEMSKPCTRCGEPVMATRLTDVGGALLCRECAQKG